jgi:hypothetical protein
MEEFHMEDEEDGIRRNKCLKVDYYKPLRVARNDSEPIRLPPGLQDLGDIPDKNLP